MKLIIAAIVVIFTVPGCAVISVPVGLLCPIADELVTTCAEFPRQLEQELDNASSKAGSEPAATRDYDMAVGSVTEKAYALQREYDKRLAKCIRQNQALAQTIAVCNQNAAAFRPSLQWGRP